MDVTGEITLPEGVEMVMPGDNVNLLVELITPVALEEGSKFRYPRRWPDRRRRRHHRDFGLARKERNRGGNRMACSPLTEDYG
jgi:hypothetical protein